MIPLSRKFITKTRPAADDSIISEEILSWLDEQKVLAAVRFRHQTDINSEPIQEFVLLKNFTEEIYNTCFDECLYFIYPSDELLFKLTWG